MKAKWRKPESQGVGRMAEPLEIAAAAEKFLTAEIAGRVARPTCSGHVRPNP